MPTYEYACTSCGEHTEAVQAFSDEALTTCPSCGGSLRKVFGNIGIVLKGSGFYKTDTRSGAGRTNGSSDGAKTDNGEGGSQEKTATKTESTGDGSTSDSGASSAKADSPSKKPEGAKTASA